MSNSLATWLGFGVVAAGLSIATAGVIAADQFRSLWCMILIGAGLAIAILGGARFAKPRR
jgi:hypothetical protein